MSSTSTGLRNMKPKPCIKGILWAPQIDVGFEHMKPVLIQSDSLETGLTGFTSTRVKIGILNY